MDTIVLLSKDCMSLESLPCYGGCKYWEGKTPNIDELVNKGTVFRRHYTAAPSTSMSMSAMLTGYYPYQFEKRKQYSKVEPSDFPSIYDKLQKLGYECHVIWDYTWINMAWKFVREFGDENKTVFHNLDIAQAISSYKEGSVKLTRNDDLLRHTVTQIYDTLEKIDFSKKQFIWIHLPHVLKGRRSYMDDMDVFDEIVGHVRKMVGDENLFITSDHGHMNMHKHKLGYGFDVYESVVRIPLIAPRIANQKSIDYITSNIDLSQIILKRELPEKKSYVVTDTKYYAQPKRKIAIIGERFKYIYNAGTNVEELYDLEWDPNENYNILEELFYDIDRERWIYSIEQYFYPYYEQAIAEYKKLKEVKDKLWRYPTFREKLYVKCYNYAAKLKKKFKR